MTVLICKLKRVIFRDESTGYHLFYGWCGKNVVVSYQGKKIPKVLKTVDYKLTGNFVNKPQGKVFVVDEYEKLGKILISKPEKKAW